MVQEETQHPSPTPADPYIARDISLLEFQRRVLEQARDKKTPLLERVKFLAIFGSNMDEFFMLRVSGVHRRIASQPRKDSVERAEGAAELIAIHSLARELYTTALECWHAETLPKLEKSGIH